MARFFFVRKGVSRSQPATSFARRLRDILAGPNTGGEKED